MMVVAHLGPDEMVDMIVDNVPGIGEQIQITGGRFHGTYVVRRVVTHLVPTGYEDQLSTELIQTSLVSVYAEQLTS